MAKRHDGAKVLHHPGDWHPTGIGPYLTRVETEAIDAVVVETSEVVEVDE